MGKKKKGKGSGDASAGPSQQSSAQQQPAQQQPAQEQPAQQQQRPQQQQPAQHPQQQQPAQRPQQQQPPQQQQQQFQGQGGRGQGGRGQGQGGRGQAQGGRGQAQGGRGQEKDSYQQQGQGRGQQHERGGGRGGHSQVQPGFPLPTSSVPPPAWGPQGAPPRAWGPQQTAQHPPAMQQFGPPQQRPPGMQQFAPPQQGPLGMQQGPQGMQQLSPPQQGPPGMQQVSPPQQGSPVMQQVSPPQQGPQGMQQLSPPQQGPPGMQQFSPPQQQPPSGPQVVQQSQPAGRGGQRGGRGGRGDQGPPRGGSGESSSSVQTPRTSPPGRGGQGDVPSVTQAMAKLKPSQGPGGDYIHIQESIKTPGKGGRPIEVYTNHFEMKIGKLKTVYHYDVAIDPDKPKKWLRRILDQFKAKHYPQHFPAFDGMKNLFSPRILPFGDEISDKIIISEENQRPKEYTVKIKKAAVIDLGEITKFFNQVSGRKVYEPPMIALQALDIVLRHAVASINISVGRSIFSVPSQNDRIIDLGNGMEMYRGHFQSVILGWKPFLNVDVANKAFPKSDNIITVIQEICGREARLDQPLQFWSKEKLNKHLKTLRIQYDLPNNPSGRKTYRVNGVDDPANKITFLKEGSQRPITVEEYYKTDKRITLKYPNMPCLWVGSVNAKVRIPCELCTILPGQVLNRKLDGEQTRQMIRHCATNTDTRKDSIRSSMRKANFNADPTVREFDLHISDDFQKIGARVLTPPMLQYANSKTIQVRQGKWNADKFYQAETLHVWTILNIDRRTQNPALEKFAEMIYCIGQRMGLGIAQPMKPFTSLQPKPRRELIDLEQYFKSVKDKVKLIFVVIPEQESIYNYVKQAAEIAVGCLTQCLKSKTVFSKMNDATVTNILLKVNAKLNGINHILRDRPPIMNQPTMIMGADVTHPSPDCRDIPSVAAVTASHDPKAFKYNICWRLQNPGKEMIADMEAITREQLMYFYRANRQMKPTRIIFYRDGVSNGQFEEVLSAELQAIRRACSSLDINYKPSITFIVVQKRHHTRLFPVNPRDSEDKNKNVPAGTCVDTEITHPTRQDFFLVSHASIQGVAKPTKYVTLWDDNDFTNDDLENLTYYLCHLFARCTRSVSYPAPTYYAHLAAARAKVYIETNKLNMSNLPHEQSKMTIQRCIVHDLPMFFI